MIKLVEPFFTADQPPAPSAALTAPAIRNAALDFTKGALVLIMVAYHTLNYFRYDVRLLRHLHFLPTSFIFIAGFLISHVYLAKARAGDTQVYRRLFGRGLKILVLFAGLNVGIHALFQTSYNRHLGVAVLAANLDAVFLSGEQRAAVFGVLLPISYLLLLSAGLLRLARIAPVVLPLFAAGIFLGCAVLAAFDGLTFNLDLVSMGILGMVAGFVSRTRLDRLALHLVILALAYLAYSIVLRWWYPTYLLNTAGVALSLLLLYAIGRRIGPDGFVAREIRLLGNYSLFAYLIQIAALQMLFRLDRASGVLDGQVLAPGAITVLVTLLAVHGVDRARAHSDRADRAYRLVFA